MIQELIDRNVEIGKRHVIVSPDMEERIASA